MNIIAIFALILLEFKKSLNHLNSDLTATGLFKIKAFSCNCSDMPTLSDRLKCIVKADLNHPTLTGARE